MSISITLTEAERKRAENYAKQKSLTLEDAFKKALFEKIEDERDAAVADEAYGEYEASGKQSKPVSELWNELGL